MPFLPPVGTCDCTEAVPTLKLGGSLETALVTRVGDLEFAKISVNFGINI